MFATTTTNVMVVLSTSLEEEASSSSQMTLSTYSGNYFESNFNSLIMNTSLGITSTFSSMVITLTSTIAAV